MPYNHIEEKIREALYVAAKNRDTSTIITIFRGLHAGHKMSLLTRQYDANGSTLLHVAAELGCSRIAEALLHGLKISDINKLLMKPDEQDLTPFDHARLGEHWETFRVMSASLEIVTNHNTFVPFDLRESSIYSANPPAFFKLTLPEEVFGSEIKSDNAEATDENHPSLTLY